MAAIAATAAKLDVGRVFQGTFGVIGRNFPSFFVLSLLFGALPSLATSVAASEYTRPGQFGAATLGMAAASWLVAIVANSVLQGALVHATVTDLNGRKASVTDCLGTGLRFFLPLIMIGVLYALLMFAGIILLIVPGIIFAVVWCVVAPVEVVERKGIFGSFGRARALTRGSRWRIFGLFLIYFILAGILQSALTAAAGGVGAAASGRALTPSLLVIPAATSLGYAMVGSAGIAVLYFELRRLRDGVGAEDLAAVFD